MVLKGDLTLTEVDNKLLTWVYDVRIWWHWEEDGWDAEKAPEQLWEGPPQPTDTIWRTHFMGTNGCHPPSELYKEWCPWVLRLSAPLVNVSTGWNHLPRRDTMACRGHLLSGKINTVMERDTLYGVLFLAMTTCGSWEKRQPKWEEGSWVPHHDCSWLCLRKNSRTIHLEEGSKIYQVEK